MQNKELSENKSKEKALDILKRLAKQYPEAKSGLVYDNPFQLFVATVLSAQTTDEQVNRITKKLFSAVPTVDILAKMQPSELEPYLKSCGLYHNKSKFLTEAARVIVEKHGGEVPDRFEDLLKLPGVGRKTANVVISSAFGKPALAVDTHVFRVSKRIGLADGKNVDSVEEQLKKIFPEEKWSVSHHQLIAHGRAVCFARKPGCKICILEDLCLYARERGVSY